MSLALLDPGPTESEESSSGAAAAASPGLSAPPVVGRFAGLPGSALDSLRSAAGASLLQARDELGLALERARSAMVAAIEEALPGFDPAARRLLLAVKRSCFNGRDIQRYRGKPEWPAVLAVSRGLAERIVTLEEEFLVLDRALDVVYRRELARERRYVLDLVHDRVFLRGVAIGRPGLVQKVRSQAPALAASGFSKPPAKWEDSLLRFVTRTAAKTSANSTLTSYALGSVRRLPTVRALRFRAVPRREVSLVRLKRPQAEQLQALLMRHPPVRKCALVEWNSSVHEVEPGRFRFIRDGHWKLEPGAEELFFVEPVRVTVTLPEPSVKAAREALVEGPLAYEELRVRMEAGGRIPAEQGTDASAALERLLDLGVLSLLPPWPLYEPWLEERIGRFLRSIAEEEPGVRDIAEAVAELVAREEAFVSAPRPETWFAEMEGSYARLLRAAASRTGDGRLKARAAFFEDVLHEPASDSGDDRGLFEIGSSSVEEILGVVRLLSRFDGLFNLRHDVHHTVAAWWREHAPGRRELPFNELAEGFAPVWREFVKFHDEAKESALATFDSLASPALASLREERRSLLDRARALVGESPGKDSISAADLAALLDGLPRRYASLVGASVFVQPADAEGSSWVLNNVTAGTGRYLSRVVPTLRGAFRDRFLDHLMARSVIELDGEEADLLEVKHPRVFNVHAHPPQAARVLAVRGLYLDLPRERQVALGELVVQADLDAETFRLVDRSGRRVLPASLSALSDSGLPNRLRFLLMFGPGEARGVFPLPWAENDGDVVVLHRLTCERVVTRRRSWRVPVGTLRESLAHASDRRSFVEVDRWRRSVGLPDEGYFQELASCGKKKPQLVRFDSPSLSRLFVSSLGRMEGDSLYFAEALPSSGDFPRDASSRPRAFELLIDQLAIRDLGGNPSAS